MADPGDFPEQEHRPERQSIFRRLTGRSTRRGPQNTNPAGPPSSSQHAPSLQTQSTGRRQNIFRRTGNGIRRTTSTVWRRLSRRGNVRRNADNRPVSPNPANTLSSVPEDHGAAGGTPATTQPTGDTSTDEDPADQPSEPHTERSTPPPSRSRGQLFGEQRREAIYYSDDPTAKNTGLGFTSEPTARSDATGVLSPAPSALYQSLSSEPAQPRSNPRQPTQAPPILPHSTHRHHASDYVAPTDWNVRSPSPSHHRAKSHGPPPPIRLDDLYRIPLPEDVVQDPYERHQKRKAGETSAAQQSQDQSTIRLVPKGDSISLDADPHDHEEDDMSKLQKRQGFLYKDDEDDGGVY